MSTGNVEIRSLARKLFEDQVRENLNLGAANGKREREMIAMIAETCWWAAQRFDTEGAKYENAPADPKSTEATP